MTSAERLNRVMEVLESDPRHASGDRLPPPLSRDDAAEIAGSLAAEVDEGTAARAEIAARDGITIACHRGCSGCCEEMIMVDLPEALEVARWLRQPENRAARDQFLAAYPAWRDAVGDAPARLATLCQKSNARGYLDAHVAQWRRRILCAFNSGGECSIYPVRPITCRNAHAVDTHERCVGDHPSGRPATRLQFPPLDEYIVRADRLMRAAHHAIGGERNRPGALCDLVYALLSP
jgi:Fe-S-cluster containining protein